MILILLVAGADGEVFEILNDGDMKAFSKKCFAAPFIRTREATPEDLAEIELDKADNVG
jgi:hypothetical protein